MYYMYHLTYFFLEIVPARPDGLSLPAKLYTYCEDTPEGIYYNYAAASYGATLLCLLVNLRLCFFWANSATASSYISSYFSR